MADRKVSVLGLGLMGTAVARSLVKAGWITTVWNRSPAKTAPLEAIGAIATASPQDCVLASPVVIAVLVSPEAVHQVLETLDLSAAEERVLFNFTTGTSSSTEKSCTLALHAGFSHYIHGAIMAMPYQVGSPESLYFISGRKHAFNIIEPVVKALGTPYYFEEDESAAAALELVLAANLYGVVTGFVQSAAMLKKSSLFEKEGFQEFMKTIWVPYIVGCAQGFFSDTGRQLDENDFITQGEGAKCSQQIHAIENIIRQSEELGLRGDLMAPALSIFKQRTEQGHGDDEVSGLVQLLMEEPV